MATHIGAATSGANAATTRAIVVPAGVLTGHLIFTAMYTESVSGTPVTITPPSGENYQFISRTTNTQPATEARTNFSVDLYYKWAESGDAGQTHTWTWSVSTWASVVMEVQSLGISSGDPNDVTPTVTVNAASSVNVVAPDITPATQPHVELTVGASIQVTVWTPPTGMTEGPDAPNITIDYLARTTTAAPGARTMVADVADWWTAEHLIVKDLGVPAGIPIGTPAWDFPHPPIRVD